MKTAFIALGANLGDARKFLAQAVNEIRRLECVKGLRASSLYKTAPVDSFGPDYLNAVVEVVLTDDEQPEALLSSLLEIENHLGRVRPVGVHNAPRVIDCDLLLFDKQRRDSEFLTLPHPRMHQRAFVLKPLLELDEEVEIGQLGKAKKYLDSVKDQRIEKILTAEEWLQN